MMTDRGSYVPGDDYIMSCGMLQPDTVRLRASGLFDVYGILFRPLGPYLAVVVALSDAPALAVD